MTTRYVTNTELEALTEEMGAICGELAKRQTKSEVASVELLMELEARIAALERRVGPRLLVMPDAAD